MLRWASEVAISVRITPFAGLDPLLVHTWTPVLNTWADQLAQWHTVPPLDPAPFAHGRRTSVGALASAITRADSGGRALLDYQTQRRRGRSPLRIDLRAVVDGLPFLIQGHAISVSLRTRGPLFRKVPRAIRLAMKAPRAAADQGVYHTAAVFVVPYERSYLPDLHETYRQAALRAPFVEKNADFPCLRVDYYPDTLDPKLVPRSLGVSLFLSFHSEASTRVD